MCGNLLRIYHCCKQIIMCLLLQIFPFFMCNILYLKEWQGDFGKRVVFCPTKIFGGFPILQLSMTKRKTPLKDRNVTNVLDEYSIRVIIFSLCSRISIANFVDRFLMILKNWNAKFFINSIHGAINCLHASCAQVAKEINGKRQRCSAALSFMTLLMVNTWQGVTSAARARRIN